MRTFKCDNCYEKCCVIIQFGANPPCRCHHDDNPSNWYEVKEEAVTDCDQLPKLTVEVFKRRDCPVWANYAVINSKGRLSFFGDKPKFEGEDYGCWSCDDYKYTHINNAFFDSTNWENSLVKRPAKALPDWCKVGEWVYYIPLTEYCKIEQMNKGFKLRCVDDDYIDIPFEDVNNLAQANKRPFNDKEMQALVGKVIENTNIVLLVNSYGKLTGDIGTYCGQYTAESLMDNGFVINGEPCYKLEHLNEKGEWVE